MQSGTSFHRKSQQHLVFLKDPKLAQAHRFRETSHLLRERFKIERVERSKLEHHMVEAPPNAVEFARQARSEQMHQYLSSIGAFAIEQSTGANLSNLLHRIDEQATSGATRRYRTDEAEA